MKVLIVNGFSRNKEGLRAFERFQSLVRNVRNSQAFKLQKSFSKEETEFLNVDTDTIDVYLFEMNSGFSSKDSEKARSNQLFDHIDMIFIDGDATILPWFPKARKRTGKVMFGCSFAMQMLTFLCATNIFVSRIVNGGGRGSTVKQFEKVSKRTLAHLEHGAMFLDSATGDLYSYDQSKLEFYPVANSSIHNHKTAQEDGISHTVKTRTTMIKSYRYIPQYFDDSDRVFATQMNEASCRVLKQYVQHWLSDGVGVSAIQFREFLVSCPNAWDVHPVNSNDTENIYKIFAESHRGPMILLYKNAVCTQFHIETRYPDSVLILQNFVKHMCEKIYTEKQRMDVPLASVAIVSVGRPQLSEGSSSTPVVSGHHSIQHSTVRHSGFAVSKRGGPVLVANNATSAAAIKVAADDSDESAHSSDESSYSFLLNGKRKVGGSPSIHHTNAKSAKRGKPKIHGPSQSLGGNLPISSTDWSAVTWSQQEIREFLHPGYPVEIMRNRPKTKCNLRLSSPVSAKPGVKFKFTPFRYCRYKEFAQPASSLRCSTSLGTLSGSPFVEVGREQLKEELRKKDKWVIEKDFQTVFRPQSRSEVKSPLITEPTSTFGKYNFRDVVRSKWRAGDFKK